MKNIIIARVNTKEQKEVNNSLPSQIVRLEKSIKNELPEANCGESP